MQNPLSTPSILSFNRFSTSISELPLKEKKKRGGKHNGRRVERLASRSEGHSSRILSCSGSIQLDVVGQLGLLGCEIRGGPALSGFDLDAENFGGELEDFVLDLTILFTLLVRTHSEIR